MKFTTSGIDTLTTRFQKREEGPSEARLFDDSGLGIRMRRGGGSYWIVQYRVAGKSKTATLGSVDKHTLVKAREWAKDQIARVTLGGDPAAAKARAKAEAAITMGSLLDRYLALKQERLRASSYRETERYLRKAWAPLHHRGVATVTRADVSKRLEEIATEHGAVSADRARAALSAFYSWAMQATEANIMANPVLATFRPAEAIARDRVLTDGELGEVWRACREDDFGRIVRLLILTGQRREEVAGMLHSEIDLAEAVWMMAGERTKNGRPHVVPLSSSAIDILKAVPLRVDRDLLFGEGAGSFSGFSRAKAAIDERILEARRETEGKKAKAMPDWRLHDLRRTAATRMADLGIGPHIIEAVLNHISGHKGGVAGVYNRSAYVAEKREALSRWAEHVGGIVSGSAPKVVSLRQAMPATQH